MPKVSVIVPVFNKAKYVGKCIESILAQTLSDIELIIVNDGSKDNSESVCKAYLTDKRVQYHLQENAGPATARQNGIDRASGEYLGFVDADDWIEPDMYEKMYNSAISADADIVMCNIIENENGRKNQKYLPNGAYNRKQIIDEVLSKSLAFINSYGQRSVIRWGNVVRLFKRSMIECQCVRFDPRFFIGEDLQFTYQATLAAQRFVYMGDEYLYHNRVVKGSLSRGYRKNLWEKTKQLIELLYQITESFSEADLMPQMHLRTFFFATETIENEFKTDCKNSKKQKIKIISEIINDPICKNLIGKLETEKMCESLLQSYYAIESSNAEKLVAWMERYFRKIRRDRFIRKKIRNPMAKNVKMIIGKLNKEG